jgi:hypothetical protein
VTLLWGGVGSAKADVVYLHSSIGQPWGSGDYANAMNTAFGAGNWSEQFYETVNPAVLFSPTTSFIYMEGSDNNANAMSSFLGSNLTTLQNWVTAGGRALMNAAPNEGGNIAFPFGVTLNFNTSYNTASGVANAVNPNHPIFQGPFTPVTTSYTGSFFSHAYLSDPPSLSAILLDDQSRMTLGEETVGLGLLLDGGMTAPEFHQPNTEANNLLANILYYGANAPVAPVPEPATLTLLGIGCTGLAVFCRRRRQKCAS